MLISRYIRVRQKFSTPSPLREETDVLEQSTKVMFRCVNTGNGPGTEEAAKVLTFMVVSPNYIGGYRGSNIYLQIGICREDLTVLVRECKWQLCMTLPARRWGHHHFISCRMRVHNQLYPTIAFSFP